MYLPICTKGMVRAEGLAQVCAHLWRWRGRRRRPRGGCVSNTVLRLEQKVTRGRCASSTALRLDAEKAGCASSTVLRREEERVTKGKLGGLIVQPTSAEKPAGRMMPDARELAEAARTPVQRRRR